MVEPAPSVPPADRLVGDSGIEEVADRSTRPVNATGDEDVGDEASDPEAGDQAPLLPPCPTPTPKLPLPPPPPPPPLVTSRSEMVLELPADANSVAVRLSPPIDGGRASNGDVSDLPLPLLLTPPRADRTAARGCRATDPLSGELPLTYPRRQGVDAVDEEPVRGEPSRSWLAMDGTRTGGTGGKARRPTDSRDRSERGGGRASAAAELLGLAGESPASMTSAAVVVVATASVTTPATEVAAAVPAAGAAIAGPSSPTTPSPPPLPSPTGWEEE